MATHLQCPLQWNSLQPTCTGQERQSLKRILPTRADPFCACPTPLCESFCRRVQTCGRPGATTRRESIGMRRRTQRTPAPHSAWSKRRWREREREREREKEQKGSREFWLLLAVVAGVLGCCCLYQEFGRVGNGVLSNHIPVPLHLIPSNPTRGTCCAG